MTDNPRAVMGGNNPPEPIDVAKEELRPVREEIELWTDGTFVEDEGQLDHTNQLIKDLSAAEKAVIKYREAVVKPLHDAWKAAVAQWKPIIDDMDRLNKCLLAAQAPFKKKLADEIEAKRKAAWEEARRLEREAEAAQAKVSPTDIDAVREAEAAKQAAQEAKNAASKAQREKVTGFKTVHHTEIEDMQAALNWIAKNDKPALITFVEQYVAKSPRDVSINGVKRWETKEPK